MKRTFAVVAVSAGLGATTAYAQDWLPFVSASLAYAAALWYLCAFAIGATTPRRVVGPLVGVAESAVRHQRGLLAAAGAGGAAACVLWVWLAATRLRSLGPTIASGAIAVLTAVVVSVSGTA